ncbi:splicing factor 3A subunit 2 [Pseudorasbora parva]|uniref:splicing factor 3A subunit 2 n=1 Tax=Pseudorasbora parva TaxID=51549 RepID=UPI00351DE954
MDFQHRAGGKTGSGGVASSSESNRDRRERLRQLALETIDINKDPYFMKNHLGSYECKLCLTLHNNEGSYLAHTQGKKHQSNLARRAAKEAKEAPAQPAPEKVKVEVKKFVKIGRPGYKVTKQRDPEVGQQSLLFQIDYPEIAEGIGPRHRFMSAYEQRIEPPDRRWQYLLFAAEPYETIAFKVPSREIDKAETRFWTHWNRETKQFFLQFHFKMEKAMPPPPGQGAPVGVKRPPSLITGLGPRQLGDSMPPPPPGGIPGMPPLPPGAPVPHHMPPQMPPPGALPPHLRPPLPSDGMPHNAGHP